MVEDGEGVQSTLDMGTTVSTKRGYPGSKICKEATQNDYQITRLSSLSVGSSSLPSLSALDAGVPSVTESSTSGRFKRPAPGADLNKAIATHDSHRARCPPGVSHSINGDRAASISVLPLPPPPPADPASFLALNR